jgi:hypothetical protein
MNSNRGPVRPLASVLGPVAGTLVVLGAFYAFVAYRLLQSTQGHLVYALDDAYIHMAIAKNLAVHGVWGVQAGTFSAASSSPLWTLLLAAGFRMAGVSDAAPLLLNTAIAAGCVVALGLVLRSEGFAGLRLFAVLLSTTLLAPIVPMVWIGMEHSLHILLTVLMAWQTSVVVRRYSVRALVTLSVIAALTVAARYEGLFVVAGGCCVLMLHRRVIATGAVALAGAAPLLIIGAWNVSHGWFLLPASILMKQTVLGGESTSFLSSVLGNFTRGEVPVAFVALFLGAIVLAGYQVRSTGIRSVHPMLIVFVVAGVLHTLLARFGYLWRYESYLMVLGALATAAASVNIVGAPARSSGEIVLALSLGAIFIFGSRTLASNAVVANTAGHIYRQQYQVARFMGQYYDGRPVVLNDIGSVSYYTRAHVCDLMGLGWLEMARLRRSGAWDRSHINDLLQQDHADIAVIYDAWFQGDRAFQRDWFRVGQWVTDVEDEPAEGTVTFYAANPNAAGTLRSSLLDFNRTLPAAVTARIDDPHAWSR